jgi:hypothetical protein
LGRTNEMDVSQQWRPSSRINKISSICIVRPFLEGQGHMSNKGYAAMHYGL